MSNPQVIKRLEILKLEKLSNAKELKEIEIELNKLEIELIKRRFWKELEIGIEAEIERLKQTREIKEKKLEKLKEKIEIKIGSIVIDIREDIGLIEEREGEIEKELEKLQKQRREKEIEIENIET